MKKNPKTKVLVTGGAGYIGSHIVVELVNAGLEPAIVDNFINARPKVLERLYQITGRNIPCHNVDVTDAGALERVFEIERPQAVIHLAGLKAVGESVRQPLRYYYNNVLGTITLAQTMAKYGCKQIVFSSTAVVYGLIGHVKLSENDPTAPYNPYGWTKLMSEQVLRDVATTHGDWNVTILRYFNPVGAHESGLIGENPEGTPNNLAPFVTQVLVGERPFLSVFGNDYRTPDGTCIRDFVHVVDLARAHVKALEYQLCKGGVSTFNIGTGRSHSVMEVLHAFEKAAGRSIPYKVVERRQGDIAEFFAAPDLAERELGWKAEKSLDDMCASAWHWQQLNPKGYA